jgi:translation elongation factor EF-G
MIREANEDGRVETIEPVMAVSVSVNRDSIGAVVSDFSARGGQIEEVAR